MYQRDRTESSVRTKKLSAAIASAAAPPPPGSSRTYLALHGASREQLRPAQRLLTFASAVTLALNVAEPICAGQLGKAAFDAVEPLLLIGWAEVGPVC
jgi:hypothetical protein